MFVPVTKEKNPEGKELFMEIKEVKQIKGETFRF